MFSVILTSMEVSIISGTKAQRNYKLTMIKHFQEAKQTVNLYIRREKKITKELPLLKLSAQYNFRSE
jgi:hypothetical protein